MKYLINLGIPAAAIGAVAIAAAPVALTAGLGLVAWGVIKSE